MSGRHSGRIIHVDDARGFGFVQPDRDGPTVFLHVSQFGGTWPPAVGTSVVFDLTAGRRGLRADDCRPSTA